MNELNKNRLIGGSVLLFAASLFIPAILNPTEHQLKNPELPVHLSLTKKTDKLTKDTPKPKIQLASGEQNIALEKPQLDLVLESANAIEITNESGVLAKNNDENANQIGKKKLVIENTTQPQLMPITLATTEQMRLQTKKTQTKAVTANKQLEATKPLAQSNGDWIRVGSFVEQKNANNLIKKLKAKNYSIRRENAKINGIMYHRVLVGPYKSTNQLQAVQKKLDASGYTTKIQYQ